MRSLIIIDGALTEYITQFDVLPAYADIFVMDKSLDGVSQLAAFLASRSEIDALYIVSNGTEETLQLGSSRGDVEGLVNDTAVWMRIGQSLNAEGQITLHGIEGHAGQTFFKQLALVTGAEVLAAADLSDCDGKLPMKAASNNTAIAVSGMVSAVEIESVDEGMETEILNGGTTSADSQNGTEFTVNGEMFITASTGDDMTGLTTTNDAIIADTTPLLDGNKAPALPSVVSNTIMPVNGSSVGSIPVAALIDTSGPLSNYFDVDGDLPGIAITGVTAYGTLYFSINKGRTWKVVGPVSSTNARVLYADTNTLLYFLPNTGCVGSIENIFTFKAWDRYGGYANGLTGINTEIALPVMTVSSTYDGDFDGVTVHGHYAYLSANTGFKIFDLRDPTHPVLVDSCDTLAVHIITVSDGYAYGIDFEGSLRVIDIHNPSHPVLAGNCDTSGLACSGAVSGSYAYVAYYEEGLRIIDISNPSHPVLVGHYDTSGLACGVAVSGNYAYVAYSEGGLRIIDISNPESPALLSTFETLAYYSSVSVVGNRIYLAGGNVVEIIDISNPNHPALIGYCDGFESAYQLAVNNDFVYVTDFEGLKIIDICNTSNIQPFSSNSDTVAITVTAPDTTAPTVFSFTPADGLTDVALTDNIVVTFSEVIQRGNGTITL